MKKLEIGFCQFHEMVAMKVIQSAIIEESFGSEDGIIIPANNGENEKYTFLINRMICVPDPRNMANRYDTYVYQSEEEAREMLIRLREAVNEFNSKMERSEG